MDLSPSASEWCEDEALLHGIYAFSHRSCSNSQSAGYISRIASTFIKFTSDLRASSSNALNTCSPISWPDLSPENLSKLEAAAEILSSDQVHWFPDYGCAVFALDAMCGLPDINTRYGDEVSILIVGLDSWKFQIHSIAQDAIEHSSTSEGSSVLHAGPISVEDTPRFFQILQKLLQEAQAKKGGARSAASNKQGHQKTPSFIDALVQDAMKLLASGGEGDALEDDWQMEECSQPRGGFTDVGLHTGGKARNTSWALVKESLAFILNHSTVYQSSSPQLFDCTLAHFYLWLLNRQVELLTPENATQLMVNATMKMLEMASISAANLIDNGFGLGHVENSCQKARQQLEAAALQRAEMAARNLQLHPEEFTDASLKASYFLPKGTLPLLLPAPVQDTNMDAAKQRAWENLSPLLLSSVNDSFSTILSKLEIIYRNKEDPQGLIAQHCMYIAEQKLFDCASKNFKVLPDGEVAALEHLVDFYRQVLQQFSGSESSQSRMNSELRSRAVLVAWLAYCLMHATAVSKYSLLGNYGVGLLHTDLGHLVLSDRASCDALLAACKYLQNRTTSAPVFTLRNPAPTLQFAEAFATGSSTMDAILKTEQRIEEDRRDSHWNKVQEHKMELEKYRAQLVKDKASVGVLEAEYSSAMSDRDRCSYHRSEWYSKDSRLDTARNKLNAARRKVQNCESMIEQWGKPICPLVHPLPKDSNLARKWIFFLYMPNLLRHLSRMTFLAQQLLIPNSYKVEVLGFNTDLADHYNSYQRNNEYSSGTKNSTSIDLKGINGAVEFVSKQIVPKPEQMRPTHIDHYTDVFCGVWHPDILSPEMVWKGSKCPADTFSGYFNPFSQIKHTEMVDFFTEKLTGEAAEDLQWAMPQCGAQTAANRANLAIASQDKRPSWLSKPGYFAFGSLRAYPYQQLRKLCVALRERTLPLGNAAVQTLVRQTLYHVGDLSKEKVPTPIWREEWEESSCSQLLQTLCGEVSVLADELQQMPRNYASVALLGEMASFFSDWHPPFLPIARRFAEIAEKFADGEEAQVVDVAPEKSKQVRAKQCVLRMNAQICHYSGNLDTKDVARMLKLAVLINHDMVYMEDDPLKQQISLMHVRCHQTMVKRINEIRAAVIKFPKILTAAVRLILQRAPADLAWEALKSDSRNMDVAAFQAVGSDGHLYSVNILDGTVLLDGWPHQRLPKSIMGHSLFQRTFGTWNFEVAGHGVYRTSSPVKGRFYEFYLDHSGDLVAIEIDDRKHELQLLYAGDGGGGSWGDQLPRRLRELYSHWISRDSAVLVLRPKAFNDHKTMFILKYDHPNHLPKHDVEYSCYRVPGHLTSSHWETLLNSEQSAQLTDQLVLHSSHVTKVLSKFEAVEYIHCYINSNFVDPEVLERSLSQRRMLFELPRYHLEFELNQDELLSLDYLGYQLASNQQLLSPTVHGYTLPDFQQYLILEKTLSAATTVTTHRPSLLVLVPTGRVLPNTQSSNPDLPSVSISVPSRSSSSLKVHKYEVHERFTHLVARSILSRLQLAALYAATCSLLPEPGSNATGAELAMDLVRQCWTNRPLGMEEVQQLEDISTHGRYAAPGLPLLTYDVHASSFQLFELHYPCKESKVISVLDPDDATAYLILGSQRAGVNPRLLLSSDEEKRILKSRIPPLKTASWLRMGQYQAIEAPVCPIEPEIITNLEKKLYSLVQKATRPSSGKRLRSSPPDYPLAAAGGTPLEKEMHLELQSSWEAHHNEAEEEEIVAGALTRVTAIAGKVSVHYKTAQRYLEHNLTNIEEDGSCYRKGFMLRRLAGIVPCAGIRDMIRLAVQPELSKSFNHFLTETSADRLSQGARVWLQLGVLQNRLQRIVNLLELMEKNPSEAPGLHALLIMELQCYRTWNVDEHPEWLVFEAEGLLQIRPKQYSVARDLIGNPGAITQLNMGEGKTRVIVPMLMLHWTRKRDSVVRLNFLPALIDEAYDHMHQYLCASVLCRKLFVQPFEREVELSVKLTKSMQASLNYCQQDGGLLLVAPEHRLSLMLKRLEEGGKPEICCVLDKIDALTYIDILDESDELLHHRFQLIYACGTQESLRSLPIRAQAAQMLLQLVSKQAEQRCGVIGNGLVTEEDGFVVPTDAEKKPGAFFGLRLLPGKALQDALPTLARELAEALVNSPPYEMRWMQSSTIKDTLVDIMINARNDAVETLSNTALSDLTEKERSDLFALRGFLSFELLAHSLQLRHRVDYGVSRLPGAKKRLAVPFRAAGTPSLRSEYAQPDSAILLTILSYYDDGIGIKELQEALKVLLSLGPSAQRDYYAEWLALAGAAVPEALNSVNKIDVSNAIQMEDMLQLFSHNMATINFWLNYCILPQEMKQFPKRLLSSAWHIAHNARGQVVGFSGTNDNHRLLPLQVYMFTIQEHSLHAINGKMLNIILESPEYNTLPVQVDQPTWEALILFALQKKYDVIVDCGALMAGVSNRTAAAFVQQQLVEVGNSQFQGVCYFDSGLRCWCVMDLTGRIRSRATSRISEARAFTIYDEARCRGADLQLRQTAVGLVTLGPKCCKDKLMQAAGRLRQLGRGQTLRFVGTKDITDKIYEVNQAAGMAVPGSNRLSPQHVLQWVMHNTVQATLNGVLEWAKQGIHFCNTKDSPAHVMLDEILDLHDLYGQSLQEEELPGVVACYAGHARQGMDHNQRLMVEKIREKGALHGHGHSVVAHGGLDEEVERETEREKEQENEVEKQIPAVLACNECDWDYKKALSCASTAELQSITELVPLSEVTKLLEPASLSSISWSREVYATRNFIHAIKSSSISSEGSLNLYMRPVDSLLLLPGGSFVLLSEREGNAFIPLMLRQAKTANSTSKHYKECLLWHLSYACGAIHDKAPFQLLLGTSKAEVHAAAEKLSTCVDQLATTQLFNGDTTYIETNDRRWDDLKHLPALERLRHLVDRRKAAASALVDLRGKTPFFSRSQLEMACGEL